MTTNTSRIDDESEANLARIAGELLAAMPPRMPERLSSPSGCGWCGGDEGANAKGETSPWRHKRDDPTAWVLHVLREHLRGLLAQSHVGVKFNRAGGATVELFDAYPEDVALFRDALGVQLACVVEFERDDGEKHCAVDFGTNPYGRQVTMVWYTTPDFLRLATQLAAAGWPFHPPA
jgi:hypothetical protein